MTGATGAPSSSEHPSKWKQYLSDHSREYGETPLNYDLDKVRRNSEPIADYLKTLEEKEPRTAERRAAYRLDGDAIQKIKEHSVGVVVVVFSAEWCPDCHRNLPVLGLIAEATGIETLVFGHIMRDSKSSTRRWAVPPSPPEVDEFKVERIPHIFVLDHMGIKIGEIIENPPVDKTLEEALLKILKGS